MFLFPVQLGGSSQPSINIGLLNCTLSPKTTSPTGSVNTNLTTSSALTRGWQHVAIVFSDTNVTIYVNGTSVSTQSGNPPTSSLVGSYSGNAFGVPLAGNYNIRIDEVKLFQGALNSTQVNEDMNVSGQGSIPVCSAGTTTQSTTTTSSSTTSTLTSTR